MRILTGAVMGFISLAASCEDGPVENGFARYVNESGETVTMTLLIPGIIDTSYIPYKVERLSPGDSTELDISGEGGLYLMQGFDSVTIDFGSRGCRAYSPQHTRDRLLPCCGEGPYRWDWYTLVGTREYGDEDVPLYRYEINERTLSEGGPCP